jgi:hypothetical protein
MNFIDTMTIFFNIILFLSGTAVGFAVSLSIIDYYN